MKFNIITFGCKVNTYESEFMKEKLERENYLFCDNYQESDIVIVNTCSVTNTSDNKCKREIRNIRKNNPNCILVVCGCLSENHQLELLDLDINILLGNKGKSQITEFISRYLETRENYSYFCNEPVREFEPMQIEEFPLTRAYIKIQDGCNNFCSYCIIPYTRKSIRSKDFSSVIEETKNLVKKGYQEIVFTGINTGAYGRETGNYDLTDLIHEVTKIDGLKRLRLSSIEITEITDKFIAEFKINPKLCAHLHVSLQSGSANILKMMNRKYTKEEYLKKVNALKMARPELNLTTDVIVGFPSETEDEFQECIEFCKTVGFSKIHVFPFSPRSKTPAAKLSDQIPNEIKKTRARHLIAIDRDLQKQFNSQYLNSEVEIIVEETKDGKSIGHTANFVKVLLEGEYPRNTCQRVLVTEIFSEYVIAKKM